MSGSTTATVSFQLPAPTTPWLDASGNVAPVWYNVLLRLMTRTGGVPGINVQGEIADLQVLAVEDMIPPPGAALESVLAAALTTIPSLSAPSSSDNQPFQPFTNVPQDVSALTIYGPETRVPPDAQAPASYGPETRIPPDQPSPDQAALLAQLMQVP